MLALSTLCAPSDWVLDRAVSAFAKLEVRAVALHRPAEPAEVRALARLARRVRVVAVFGTDPLPGADRQVLVVEGGAAGEDREASLEELCRRLHPLRDFQVGLRTPESADGHPAPAEIELVNSSLGNVGYWHDASRGGDEYLDAGQPFLRGASFHPLHNVDLPGIRDALPSGAPAVVTCASGTPMEEIREAIACARGTFGA